MISSIIAWVKRHKGLTIFILVILTFFAWKHIPSFRTRYYDVELSVYPIQYADYTQFENFGVSLSQYTKNPTVENRHKMECLAKNFNFGKKISLISYDEEWGKTSHSFIQNYTIDTTTNEFITYQFDNFCFDSLKPINIKLTVPVKPFAYRKPKSNIDFNYLTSATKTWPVDSPSIQKLTHEIIQNETDPKMKVFKILKWVDKNIKWSRKDRGTRFGPIKVIQQGYGRCCDFSDVFISICRAAGIPTRQVYGYIYKKGGHAWCEVFIEGKGWIQVDPAIKRLGVLNSYIPFSISENGEISFLYDRQPRIELKN